MSSNPEGAKRFIPFAIIGVVLAAVIVAVVLMSRPGNTDNAAQQSGPNVNASLPARQPLPGAPGPPVRGNQNATVTLEEFADFQCPACGGLDPGMRRVMKDYGDRVKLIFREFPLPMHKYGFIAARAAEAAGQQGKFWEMHDALYDNQKEWSDSDEPRNQFDAYASRLGLDVQRLRADLERQDLADRIKQDVQRGNSLGVRGTPTVFLNGRELVPGKLVTEDDLRRELDAALAAASK